jgi:hypothetical protein
MSSAFSLSHARSRASRQRRIAALVATVVVACLVAALSVLVQDARAQGTGFSGDVYYANNVFEPGTGWGADPVHSYGFNSATNTSISARGYVRATIWNLDTGTIAATSAGSDLARTCVIGTYPNCTDTDGWSGEAWVYNNAQVNLRIEGHGVY